MRLLLALMLSLPAVGCAGGPAPAHGAGAGGGMPPRSGVFISPMGEPFRSEEAGADLVARWFGGADEDRDGRLVLAEVEADADRFFRTLDSDGDGEIEPGEMRRYESEVAPEVGLASRMRGGPGRFRRAGGPGGAGPGGGGPSRPPRRRAGGRPGGAGWLGLLGLPQPVAAADADMNRGVSLDEFRRAAGQRFLRLDSNRDAALTPDELMPPPPPERSRRR